MLLPGAIHEEWTPFPHVVFLLKVKNTHFNTYTQLKIGETPYKTVLPSFTAAATHYLWPGAYSDRTDWKFDTFQPWIHFYVAI